MTFLLIFKAIKRLLQYPNCCHFVVTDRSYSYNYCQMLPASSRFSEYARSEIGLHVQTEPAINSQIKIPKIRIIIIVYSRSEQPKHDRHMTDNDTTEYIASERQKSNGLSVSSIPHGAETQNSKRKLLKLEVKNHERSPSPSH